MSHTVLGKKCALMSKADIIHEAYSMCIVIKMELNVYTNL